MKYRLLIVVPTLNSFNLIERQRDSLIKQTFKNWRVIFIDGGSKKKHISFLENLCEYDKRFSWVPQKSKFKGIFGAMNQFTDHIFIDEFVIFWGSDDWVHSKDSFRDLFNRIDNTIIKTKKKPDIIFAKARYLEKESLRFKREALFINRDSILNSKQFNLYLFMGFSPPHQATIFSSKVLKKIKSYNEKYYLSADLDYFFRLSKVKNLFILNLDLLFVNILSGGVSEIKIFQRLKQVIIIYFQRYKILFLSPFILRYFRKIFSLWKI